MWILKEGVGELELGKLANPIALAAQISKDGNTSSTQFSKSFSFKDTNPCCPIDFYLHPLQRPSPITHPEVRTPTRVTNKAADEVKCRSSNSISPSMLHQLGLPGVRRNVASIDTNPCCPIDFYLHPLQRPSHITHPEVRAPTRVTNKAADEDKCRPSNSISPSMPHQLGLPDVRRMWPPSLRTDDEVFIS
ncbi:hypothetical protein CEXT_395801 [Caerostris extrusa]|uniref:Uncharacterized protein n=1 Tax=Caerostris extrusa TaxID=172846 RepID=A0AAV4P6M6_CAEEX|nr:hypothetical protein CEXT_395801 [Caerostris extrusa]